MPQQSPIGDETPPRLPSPVRSPPFAHQFAEAEELANAQLMEEQPGSPESLGLPSLSESSTPTTSPQSPILPLTPPGSPDLFIQLENLRRARTSMLRRRTMSTNREIPNRAVARNRVPRSPSRTRRYSIPRLLSQRPPSSNTTTVNPTNTVAGRRRTHFDAFGTPPDTYGIAIPPSIRRRLCSVYAVEVQVGDILKYGNALNDGCKVTEADLRGQALSTEGDTNDDYEETIQVRDAPPVNLNGTVRIQWETKDGQSKLSQYFAGLEKLEVLRVIGKRGNREE